MTDLSQETSLVVSSNNEATRLKAVDNESEAQRIKRKNQALDLISNVLLEKNENISLGGLPPEEITQDENLLRLATEMHIKSHITRNALVFPLGLISMLETSSIDPKELIKNLRQAQIENNKPDGDINATPCDYYGKDTIYNVEEQVLKDALNDPVESKNPLIKTEYDLLRISGEVLKNSYRELLNSIESGNKDQVLSSIQRFKRSLAVYKVYAP